MRRLASAFVVLLLWPAAPDTGQKAATPLKPIAPLDLAGALDLYAAGRFDEAVAAVARAGNEIGRNLRGHWFVTGAQWIEAAPADRRRRILAAVSLALETEHICAERGDWRSTDGNPPCAAASCVLDWAQAQLVARGAPDRAERAWYLAAAALAGGVRDWRYLYRPIDPARRSRLLPGLMDRALAQFPDDAPLRLEQAIAAAGRFQTIVDGGRAPGNLLPNVVIRGRGGELLSLLDLLGSPDTAVRMLTALGDDPTVGPEATLRLGYLQWAQGQNDAARDALARAAAASREHDVRYLAQFLLGWTAMTRGDSADAIPLLEAALATRPGSQSAALALAALELQRGDADKAHEIARASLDARGPHADPWRLFLYGHHSYWPARIAELRREVKP